MTEEPMQPAPEPATTAGDRGARSTLTQAADVFTRFMSKGTAMPAIASLVLIVIFFQSQSEYFLTPVNLTNLSVQITLVAIIAMGQVVVLLLGEIDLSMGSLAGTTAAILGVLMATGGLPWWIAVPLMLLCGAALGAFQGAWIAILGIPSFIVTLAGMMGFLGLQLWIPWAAGYDQRLRSHHRRHHLHQIPPELGWILAGAVAILLIGQAVLNNVRGGFNPKSLIVPVFLAAMALGMMWVFNQHRGMPLAFLLLLGMLLVGWWITERTVQGRYLFAVGGNAEASRRAGLPVMRIRWAAFAVSGTLAGVGGLFAVSYNGSAGTLTGGGTLLLTAIGAAVIGGTSLFGGRGSIWSALVGALIMGAVANGLDLMAADQPAKFMVQGSILLLAVSLDTILRRRQTKGRK